MSTWFRQYGFGQVHPDLFVGAYPRDREDVAEIDRLGVDRVLNLVQDTEYDDGERDTVRRAYSRRGIGERRSELVDFGHLPTDQIDEAVDIVLGWLAEGRRVYVHCRAGWQRSAAVAAGAIALHDDLTIQDALALVRERKPTADPLPHQRDDLERWWRERASHGA